MNLTRPIESQLEMARDLACEMTTCADALNLEQKLSFYWSARQIVTCGRLYLSIPSDLEGFNSGYYLDPMYIEVR